jgi:hypothetical protein
MFSAIRMGLAGQVRWTRALRGLTGALIASALGCAQPAMPDPRHAARKYADAVESGDDAAVYAMLTEASRRKYGADGIRRLMVDAKSELRRQAKKLRASDLNVEAAAQVPFVDGESAVLEVEDGRFKVSAASALPSGARTPAEALGELRQVLARRSYPGLMRVLSAETRGALERDLRSLVSGLERPETLDVKVSGDRAEVQVPGGHKVWLKREAGVWRVYDFQ